MRDAQELATAYDQAWVAGDANVLQDILAQDVSFVGPFAKTTGQAETVAGLVEMSKLVTSSNTKIVLANEADAIVWADVATKAAPSTATATWIKTTNGTITSIELLIDTAGWR